MLSICGVFFYFQVNWNTGVGKQLTLTWDLIPTMLNMITYYQYSTSFFFEAFSFKSPLAALGPHVKYMDMNAVVKKHNNTNFCYIRM